MKCPWCRTSVDDTMAVSLHNSDFSKAVVYFKDCIQCRKRIIWLPPETPESDPKLIYPATQSRDPAPAEVTNEDPDLAKDYDEACKILELSPQSSATLARRCLQRILREKIKVKPGNLSDEIEDQEVAKNLAPDVVKALHGVRSFGNFAAHPTESWATGEILKVDLREAECCLDVITLMFNAVYVAPAQRLQLVNQLNTKLAQAGKRPI